MHRILALAALMAGLSTVVPFAHAAGPVASDAQGPCYTTVIQESPDGTRQIIVIRIPCP